MEFLKKIAPYIFIVRPKNLLIIGFTQFILYHFLFATYADVVALSGHLLNIFILDTILIAAGGYIINDIIDYKSDAVNKPDKTYLLNDISIENAKRYYYLILFAGLVLSVYIAIKTNNIPLIALYPMVCAVLYLYSSRYKSSVLTGNVIVSLFVAFVPGIILLAERNLIFNPTSEAMQSHILQVLIFYITFSFLINFIREIIKDIEDIEGDKNMGYVTLPIKYSILVAKRWSIFLSLASIVLLLTWMFTTSIPLDFRIMMYLLLLVAAPLVVIIQILTKTTHKRDFSKISTILKWIMLAGLGALILITKTIP